MSQVCEMERLQAPSLQGWDAVIPTLFTWEKGGKPLQFTDFLSRKNSSIRISLIKEGTWGSACPPWCSGRSLTGYVGCGIGLVTLTSMLQAELSITSADSRVCDTFPRLQQSQLTSFYFCRPSPLPWDNSCKLNLCLYLCSRT